MEKLAFLKSVRFWKLMALAIVAMLHAYNTLTPEISILLETILGGSITIRTIDRFGEKVGNK